ncbi:chorismate mutase 2, cytosolic-like [Zingiber officinale]|uniref:Chorismate mutase n=1 Tax=Zingiber officinale TaxID=94328 RepID=A0A8J5FX84_ZINOF|nr:chorismate mutase 2, cytosolic-like [Zingiber officinale]KAG6493837.1 hypothetical protein ZIOFF_048840 [Zingiber officinale]
MSMASRSLLYAFSFLAFASICSCRQLEEKDNQFSLASVREFLTREEDSIVFSLIERAKYPSNFPVYDPSYLAGAAFPYHNHSLVDIFVRESEAVQARAGRYQNPEEIPFFPESLVPPLVPPYQYPKVLYPAAASVNVRDTIWKMYFDQLLPQFTSKGDDGRYALTAAADLVCLQALSRRIHYGRFVSEAKFRDAPNNYSSAIRAKDRDALMRLLTFEVQEETVKRRVEEKAKVFGQDVTVDNGTSTNESSRPQYKVDPNVVYHLYGNWVIPFTKQVEVEYLLHRLD